jgi:signal transduction histidine kinase
MDTDVINPSGPPPAGESGSARSADVRPADLLAVVLGPQGLPGAPGVTHAEIEAAACTLVQQLLAVDECWIQPPGPLSEVAAAGAGTHGDAWFVNLAVPSVRSLTTNRFNGALAGVPVEVAGDRHTLLVYSRRARTWSGEDLALLQHAAALVRSALVATLDRQLSPAQHARARYDELRGELLSLLNHELRTPLTSLGAGLELLADLLGEDLTPPTSSVLARMEQNLQRLRTLTSNVTLLGDVATARSRLDAATFEPADPDEVARLCLGQLVGPGVPFIRLHEAGCRLLVAASPAELREVLDRVLGNAAKFTGPDGRIDVTIAASTSQVSIVIADSGIGVPEAEHHGLGQSFFRATNARHQETQGAGLGLAAASAIARRWGGAIQIDSIEGRGATVKVLVPRIEVPIL